mgnify:CR=1 FL=1
MYLEELRNEIVHNRAFENSATCYISLENGIVKERFFLLPDSNENGRLPRWNEDANSTRKKIKERSAFPRFTERYRFEYRIPWITLLMIFRKRSARCAPAASSR